MKAIRRTEHQLIPFVPVTQVLNICADEFFCKQLLSIFISLWFNNILNRKLRINIFHWTNSCSCYDIAELFFKNFIPAKEPTTASSTAGSEEKYPCSCRDSNPDYPSRIQSLQCVTFHPTVKLILWVVRSFNQVLTFPAEGKSRITLLW